MFLLCSVATSEKKALSGNQTRRGSLALCQVVTYCKYVTSSRRVISLITRKRMMNSLKQWCNGRANGATIGKRQTLNNTKWLRKRKKILRGRKPKIREHPRVLHSFCSSSATSGRVYVARSLASQGSQLGSDTTSVTASRWRKPSDCSTAVPSRCTLWRSNCRGRWKPR